MTAKPDRTGPAAATPSEPGAVVETVVASAPEPTTRPSDDRPVPNERKEPPAGREPSPEKQPSPPPTQPDRPSMKNAIQPVDPFSGRAEDDFPTDRSYTQPNQAAATTSLPDPAPVTTTLLPAPPVTTTTTAVHPPAPPAESPTPPDEERTKKKPVPPFPTPDIPAATERETEPAVERSAAEPSVEKVGDKIRPDQVEKPTKSPNDHKSAAKTKSSVDDEVASADSSVKSGEKRPASKTYWIDRIRAFKRSGSLFIQVRVSHRSKAMFYRFKEKDGDTWLVVDFPNTKRKLHIKGLVRVRSSVIRRIRSADHENSVRLSAAVRPGVKFRASAKWRRNTFELRITPRK